MSVILFAGLTAAGSGSPVQVTYPEPDLDRWMYPFNSSPGTRQAASTFSAVGFEEFGGFGFDQRDGQFLVGFDTDADVATGAGPCGYIVESATLTATVSIADAFGYDPTQDPWQSYIPDDTDPDQIPDPDPGTGLIETARPLELFGVAYRGGFDVFTFTETSPFGPIDHDVRNAYPSDFIAGMPEDVSNNVRDEFDPRPFAIGVNDALTPGQTVPADTTFTFEMDVNDPDIQQYLAQGLSDGRINLLVTSLQPAQSEGGAGTGEFATFYTREDTVFGIPATLELSVSFPVDGDADGDGAVTTADISYVIFRLGNTGGVCVDGDANGDGAVDSGDISYVIFRLGNS